MKITKRQLKRIIKEEAADCIKDYLRMGYSRSQAAKECGEMYDDDGYSRRSYRRRSPRKTSYVGTSANAEKIEAISLALDKKPGNKFLTSIKQQLTGGRGLSAKQNAIVRKILAKANPEAVSLFEGNTLQITRQQLRRIIEQYDSYAEIKDDGSYFRDVIVMSPNGDSVLVDGVETYVENVPQQLELMGFPMNETDADNLIFALEDQFNGGYVELEVVFENGKWSW